VGRQRMISERGAEGQFLPSFDVDSFVTSIARPRTILVMVKAGSPVDEAIAELRPHLSPGDIVIDGGNSYFKDTQRRCAELEGSGLALIGTGVSGGGGGALRGASLMPGGTREAYRHVVPLCTPVSALR